MVRYSRVWPSMGKYPMVAPYSGDMLEMVALSATDKLWHPGPKNSTNYPTTPLFLSIWTIVRTKSVAVVSGGRDPVNLNPTTLGRTIEMVCPNMVASASIPPTPQPTTPSPLIIVVCESVPTTESGYKTPLVSNTTLARYYKFT